MLQVETVLPISESLALGDANVEEEKEIENCTIVEIQEKTNMDFAPKDNFHRAQKVNSVASIAILRMKPHSISRLGIPLCHLAVMPMVRLALQSDIARLQEDFVIGYRDGSAVFYVSVTNE